MSVFHIFKGPDFEKFDSVLSNLPNAPSIEIELDSDVKEDMAQHFPLLSSQHLVRRLRTTIQPYLMPL